MHRYVLQNQEGKNGGKEFATIQELSLYEYFLSFEFMLINTRPGKWSKFSIEAFVLKWKPDVSGC